MNKYDSSNNEYEMLKGATQHNNQNNYSEIQYNTNSVATAQRPNNSFNAQDNIKSIKGIASLVLGLITLLLFHFWFVALPTGILSIVLGVKSNKQRRDGKGKAGIVLSIIGLSIMALIYGICIILLIIENA